MTANTNQHDQEKRLWRQFVSLRSERAASAELDPNVLAAYLDGKTDSRQSQQVEDCLASDPAFLQEFLELRQMQSSGQAVVSESLLVKAKALVLPAKNIQSKPQPTVAARIGTPWARLRWIAAAAAVLLACLGGYSVGGLTYRGQYPRGASAAPVASAALDEFVGESVLASLLQPNGGNGGGQ